MLEKLDTTTAMAWTRAIAGQLDAGDVIGAMLSAAFERFGAEQAGMIQCDADGLAFLPDAHVLSTTGMSRLATRSPDVPLSAALDILKAGAPWVPAPEAQRHGDAGSTVLCTAVESGSALHGVLFVKRRGRLTAAGLAELRFLSGLAGTALRNARAHASVARGSQVREVLNTNILGIFIWERGGRILEANEAFLRIVGYGGGFGLPASLDVLTPEEWKPAIARREAQFSSGEVLPPFEREFLRRDGSRAPVLVTATRLDEDSRQRVTFVLDLTERRRIEETLERTKAELEHVSKVTALTALTGSIAHEINQPLAAIVANGSAAIRWLDRPRPVVAEALESVERMVFDGHRAGAIIAGIRSLLTRHPTRRQPVDMNSLIETTVLNLRRDAARSKVQIRLHLEPGIPMVMGDEVQLQQLLGNLLVNGIEAMLPLSPEARSLSIRSSLAGECVEVSVHDAGSGMDASIAAKVFDPFFTTKQEGLGMGLSISRLIVEAHQGRLWVDRDEKEQTTFHFALPVARAGSTE
ncbi:sensor histidine kinase [Cupriavidus agavae]|uniref:histidine kinase n=1 Tax=Cupriavidus agavae TaxID=1001822 RepID=A0A4Q7RZ88_9BURK|nr:ATP-binding protein [Cupriavidus agavae]RZT39173.1 PAS domain S-box-containing protein [Cupriavidus agavae]